MKRSLIILILIAPALVNVFFVLIPQADMASPQPIFHFYSVTFISLAAAVVSMAGGGVINNEPLTMAG